MLCWVSKAIMWSWGRRWGNNKSACCNLLRHDQRGRQLGEVSRNKRAGDEAETRARASTRSKHHQKGHKGQSQVARSFGGAPPQRGLALLAHPNKNLFPHVRLLFFFLSSSTLSIDSASQYKVFMIFCGCPAFCRTGCQFF